MYKNEDLLWEVYKRKLRDNYSDLCSEWEITYAEELIKLCRDYVGTHNYKLINLQSSPRFGPEYEDVTFKIEWNKKSKHHFSFDIESPTEVQWMYLNYATQEMKWGEWDFSNSKEIPKEALEYLILLGEPI
jgi:hypothetical protein